MRGVIQNPVRWRNSKTTYGEIAKALHWVVAILFLVSYLSIYYRHWFAESQSDVWRIAGNAHRCAGISIAVLVILRIIWRIVNSKPDLPPGPRWEHQSASVAHYALYFVMVAMPATGYFGTDAATNFGIFLVPNFAETDSYQWIASGAPFDKWEVPLDYLHRRVGGAFLVLLLIVLHVGAALYHQFYRKDNVLIRMLPGDWGSQNGREESTSRD